MHPKIFNFMSIYWISTCRQTTIEHWIVLQIFRIPILTIYVFSCHVLVSTLRAKNWVLPNIEKETSGFETQSYFSYLYYLFAI